MVQLVLALALGGAFDPETLLDGLVRQRLMPFPREGEILKLREVARRTKDATEAEVARLKFHFGDHSIPYRDAQREADQWLAKVYSPWSRLHAASRRDVVLDPEVRVQHLEAVRKAIGDANFLIGKMPDPTK